MLLYQILASTIREKILKSHTKTMNLKYQLPRGMMNLNHLTGHILYQIFRIILTISLKNMKKCISVNT